MTWPAVVALLLMFFAMLPRSPYFLLYLFFGFGPFASLSMLGDAGGVNILPQSVCGVLLVCKLLLAKGQIPRAFDVAIDPSKLGFLFAFLFYGLFSAYVMPRLFAHMMEIVEMNPVNPGVSLLQPAMANYNQSAYMMLSVGIALAFAVYAERANFRRHYIQALWVMGVVLIATGLVDLFMAAAGLESLLEPFRNAYSILSKAEVLGAKRVVGLTPEASSYGTMCVAAASNLVFIRPCFERALLRNYLVPLTSLSLLAMAVLSTSSAAYVGLAVFSLLFAVNWVRRALSAGVPAREGLKWEAIASLAAGLVLLAVFALVPSALDPVYAMIDELIFKKSQTDSYVERTMWTRLAMNAFYSTYGLGVGLGSVRTSNWFVSILSSTGLIGAGLLGWFILRLYVLPCRATDARTRELATGLKFGLLPTYAMSALVGTTPDIGVGPGAALGVIACLISMNPAAILRSKGTVGSHLRARSHPR
jgi:hypothetical protein